MTSRCASWPSRTRSPAWPTAVCWKSGWSRRWTTAAQGQHHGALLFLDLDAFKPLNDTHGHAAGDAVLVAVAQRLRQAVRATDVVARLGGDEFVVLLSPLSHDAQQAATHARQVADKLRQLLDPLHRISPPGVQPVVEHRCAASVGIAVFGPQDHDRHAVLQRADEAMYAVKAESRARRGKTDPR